MRSRRTKRTLKTLKETPLDLVKGIMISHQCIFLNDEFFTVFNGVAGGVSLPTFQSPPCACQGFSSSSR